MKKCLFLIVHNHCMRGHPYISKTSMYFSLKYLNKNYFAEFSLYSRYNRCVCFLKLFKCFHISEKPEKQIHISSFYAKLMCTNLFSYL